MFFIVACGDDSNDNDNNNASGSQNTFNATVEGQNAPGPVSNDTPEPQQGVMFAQGAGSILQLFMLDKDGKMNINVFVDTSVHTLPGTVPVTEINGSAFVQMTIMTTGIPYESQAGQGTIEFSKCANVVGQRIEGRFNNVVLKDSTMLGGDFTLNGTFSLTFLNQAGTLTCAQASNNSNNHSNNNNNSNNNNTCTHEMCSDPGHSCCPYMQCLGGCFMGCAMSDCMGTDVASCNGCLLGCYPTCNVSGECQTAATALETCMSDAGCNMSDEDPACAKQHCCSEFTATF